MDKDRLIGELYFYTAKTLLEGYKKGYEKKFFSPDWSIEDNNLLRRVQNNIFAFSGAKTYSQLQTLRDAVYENGRLLSSSEFRRRALLINANYNLNYLDAERHQVIAAGTAGSRWIDIQQTKDTHPYLFYETANDEHVREEHRRLHGIILRIDDSFWLLYYPPNGWRCRCRVRKLTEREYQHLIKGKNSKVIDSETAQQIAGKVVAKPFRHNVGISEIFEPQGHPYFKANEDARQMQLSATRHYGMKPVRDIYRDSGNLSLYKRRISTQEEYRNYWASLEEKYGKGGDGFTLIDRENNISARFDRRLMEKMIERERYNYFDEVTEVFSHPDEVWGIFKGGTKRGYQEEFFNVYLKYYNDTPVVLLIDQGGRVDSFYKLDTIDTGEQFRRGLLKQRR